MGTAGVDLGTASAFASVGLPYTFKWAWAPLFDRFAVPWLGRRRGWIVLLEMMLVAAIVALATVGLAADAELIAVLAVSVAALSASHDVVVDAFLAESLAPDERPAGSAAYVLGYRAALLVVGGGGLVLAAHSSWPAVFGGVAALVPLGALGALLLPEPTAGVRPPSALGAIVGSLWSLLERPGAIAVLCAVATFRFGEHLVLHVQGYFLTRVARLDVDTIGWVTQVAGFAGLAAGGALLAVAAPRLGPRRSLFVFGGGAAAANLGWAIMAWSGASLPLFLAVAFVDSFGTALASGAFVAFLMGQCTTGRSATQYAMLNALSSVGGRVFGFVSAPIVARLGWGGFFAATAVMVVPALAAFALTPRARFDAGAGSSPP
jgi:PAT family beta-lactamase induction signal transducer AmpG